MMADTLQLATLKKRLATSLAGRWTMYLELLRRWITFQIKREDFEVEARTLMRQDEVALHNDYLVELLFTFSKAATSAVGSSIQNSSSIHPVAHATTSRHVSVDNTSQSRRKASNVHKDISTPLLPHPTTSSSSPIEESMSPPGKAVSADITRRAAGISCVRQRKRKPTESSQPPAIKWVEHPIGLFVSQPNTVPILDKQLDMPNVVSFAASVPQAEIPAPHCSFLMREQAFPESALLYGRMLVVAYEHGLDDIDAATVELMLQALRSQLLRVIGAMVDRRAACNRRRLTHFGSGVTTRTINPYLAGHACTNLSCDLLESIQLHRELSAPSVCDAHSSSTRCTLFDLVDALRTDRRVISSHTVFTLTMERALLSLRNVSHEELESDYIFSQQRAITQQILKQQQQSGLTSGSCHSRLFGSSAVETSTYQHIGH